MYGLTVSLYLPCCSGYTTFFLKTFPWLALLKSKKTCQWYQFRIRVRVRVRNRVNKSREMSRSHCFITERADKTAKTTTNLKLWSCRDVFAAFMLQHLYRLLCVCVDARFSAVDRAWFHWLLTARASTMLHTSRHTCSFTWCLQVKTDRIKLCPATKCYILQYTNPVHCHQF